MKPCRWCGTQMLATNVVTPWRVIDGATVGCVQVYTVHACPVCDRPKCNNAGCGLPTGPLLPIGQRELTPTSCEHCKLPIRYKAPKL